jgi:D-glycero-alpha-D-manno-heptose-7-phosphate kinase
MIYRSKAPLRIGLAGGGTDVSPYSDLYGGAILNATLSLYAHATIEPIEESGIILTALDRHEEQRFEWANELPLNGTLDLLKGVYNRIQKDYGLPMTNFRLSTFVDAPAGSGLGTSSTLVVAIIGAFAEMLRLPLGEYDIAQYAYEIERKDLNLAGGKQDQYAATFGGVNFMEFFDDEKVVVNPLRIKDEYLFELENNLLLYYTSTGRESAKIIEKQSKNVMDKNEQSIEAMHQLKQQAQMMKEALLKGRLHEIGEILDGKSLRRNRRKNFRSGRRRLYDFLLPGKYQTQCFKKLRTIWRQTQKVPVCTARVEELDDINAPFRLPPIGEATIAQPLLIGNFDNIEKHIIENGEN